MYAQTQILYNIVLVTNTAAFSRDIQHNKIDKSLWVIDCNCLYSVVLRARILMTGGCSKLSSGQNGKRIPLACSVEILFLKNLQAEKNNNQVYIVLGAIINERPGRLGRKIVVGHTIIKLHVAGPTKRLITKNQLVGVWCFRRFTIDTTTVTIVVYFA